MSFTYIIPVGGTGGRYHDWAHNDHSAFLEYAHMAGLLPRRLSNGTPWTWSGELAGLWWQGVGAWEREALSFTQFVSTVPYAQRNVIAHSHGGNVVIIACRLGLKIRTLTTVGTPVRKDVHPALAVQNIGYWQHIYDLQRDFIQSMRARLGQLGDHHLSLARSFQIPGVSNRGVQGIEHSRILSDASQFYLWKQNLWFEAIRSGPPLDKADAHA